MVSFRHVIVRSLPAFGSPRFFSLLSSSQHQGGITGAITWVGVRSRYLSSAAEVTEYESDKLHDDGKAREKDSALRMALSRLAGDFNC